MQSKKRSGESLITRVVIFPFESIATVDLEQVAAHILPLKLKRKSAKSEDRIRSYYAGRCALASLFSRCDESFFVAPNQEYGYLELFNAAGHKENQYFVNLSHTESIVVAAISNHSVGIDIELKRRSARRVISRVMTEAEKTWISDELLLPEREIETSIFLWSAKEAFSKALGLGMKFGFKAFHVERGFPPHFVASTTLKGPLDVKKPGIFLDEYEEYFITLCSEQDLLLAGIDRHVLSRGDFGILRDKLDGAK